MKMFKVFLDDVRESKEIYQDTGWIICREMETAQKLMRLGCVTHLSLDGDMGLANDGRDLPGGLDLLDWMRATNTWPSTACLVHSDNGPKAQMMRVIIQEHFVPKG